MSSGSQTTVSSTELPGWMQPYAQSYLNQSSGYANRPYQAYGGQTVAGLDPMTLQGMNMTQGLATGGTQEGNAGSQLLTDTLSGKYMGANPYLDSQVQQAQADTVNAYNTVAKPQMESAMVRSGSFGNSGLQQMQQQQQSDLTKNLGNISSGMRFNAYNTERQNMQNALGMAPAYNNMQFGNAQALTQAGQLGQQNQQAQLSDAYQKWLEQRDWGVNQLGVLGNALGTLRGQGTTTQTANNPNGTFNNIMGTALMASYLFSDRDLKTDIKKVGKTDEGLNVYTYKYKWGGPTQMGVMAQEVEKKRPEAVTEVGGYKAVNYGMV